MHAVAASDLQADKVGVPVKQFGRQVYQPEPMARYAFGAEDVAGIEFVAPLELDRQIDLAQRGVDF